MKKRMRLKRGLAGVIAATILAGGCVSLTKAPADPAEIVVPVCEPLLRGPLVTIEWISVNGQRVPGDALQRAVERFDDSTRGEVRLVEGTPVQLDLGEDGAVSKVQYDTIFAGAQSKGPFEIPIVIVPDCEFEDNPAYYQFEYEGDTSKPDSENRFHRVLVNVRAMDTVPNVPVFYPAGDWWTFMLAHELHHSLGIPTDPARLWYGSHCTDPGCVLYPGVIDARSLLWVIFHLGPPAEHCDACMRELAAAREQADHSWWNPEQDYGRQWLNQCVQLNADKPDVYVARLRDSLARRDFPLMLTDAGKLIELEPGEAEHYRLRGRVYSETGDWTNAVSDFETALHLDGDNIRALDGLAWICATAPESAHRNGARAVELATRACELSEWKDGNILATLAAASAEVGDFKAAIRHQNAAIALLDADDEDGEELRQHLAVYRSGKPWRGGEIAAEAAE